MNGLLESIGFHSRIIPIQIDKVELAKRRRELAILRYELMRRTGIKKWKITDQKQPTPKVGD